MHRDTSRPKKLPGIRRPIPREKPPQRGADSAPTATPKVRLISLPPMIFYGRHYIQDLRNALTVLEEHGNLGLDSEHASRLRFLLLKQIERAEAANYLKKQSDHPRIPKILVR